MGILNWFLRSEAKVEVEAHDLAIGNNVDLPNLRIASRLGNLYDWFEQKGDSASIEKYAAMQASLKKHGHMLAGRGFRMCESAKDARIVLHQIIREAE